LFQVPPIRENHLAASVFKQVHHSHPDSLNPELVFTNRLKYIEGKNSTFGDVDILTLNFIGIHQQKAGLSIRGLK
jgi:hypothetical protein